MMKLLLALLSLVAVRSLDVELVGITCNESLPIYASMYMQCADGGSRCTFGDSVTISGSFQYNGVYNTGIDENYYAYSTADLSLWTLDFNLFDMMQVPLCDESMVKVDENENVCPYDGEYEYSIEYKLPKAGKEHTSWLASGWQGSGLITIYAEPDESMLIGSCSLDLRTYVTQSSDSLVGTPSAAQTAGIVLGVMAASALLCLYCCCCCGKKKKTEAVSDTDEVSTFFKRMEDEKSFGDGTLSKDTKSIASSELA